MKAAIAFLVLGLSSPVSDVVPRYDLEALCRASTSAMDGTGERLAGCIRDETSARDQAMAMWATVKPATRATCAGEQRGIKSYVELVTCVQLFEGAK